MATHSSSLGDHDYDAPHRTGVTSGEDARTILINRVSWGAVFAGVFVALVAQLLLNMLGLGIGMATLDPATGDSPAPSTFSIGAALWWTVSGVVAAFLGGVTAGRLSGQPKESSASWHGLVSWALSTLIVVALLTTAVGSIIGGSLSALGSAIGGIGSTAGTVAQSAAPAVANAADPFAAIERQVRSTTGGQDPQAIRDGAVAAVKAAVTGDPAEAERARERAADTLSKAQSISQDEARQQIAQYEQQYRQAVEQAKQKATQAADVAAGAASRGALFGFVALLLGAIAAWFGGRSGAVEPTITDLRYTPTGHRDGRHDHGVHPHPAE
jgi:hypothetical protein